MKHLVPRSQPFHAGSPDAGALRPRPGRAWPAWLRRVAGAADRRRGDHGLAPLRRPGPPAPNAGAQAGEATPGRRAADAFERLVALYTEASTLRECARVETGVGADAQSCGDGPRATEHVCFSRHYHRRAEEVETAIWRELDRLRRERLDWERLAASARTRAGQRRYGPRQPSGGHGAD